MANILDLLRKNNPNLTLDDARKAMGIPSGNTFDMYGNQVPTQDNTPELPLTMSPLQTPVPAEPQIYNESYDPIASLDIERNPKEPFNPFQSANAPKPSPSISRPKSTQPRAETPSKQFKLPQDDLQQIDEENKKEEEYKGVENQYAQEEKEALDSTPEIPEEDQSNISEEYHESPETYAQQLARAQGAANDTRLLNSLAQAGELIGSSIAGAKPIAQDIFKQNIANADQPVKDLSARIEMESHDSQSAYSKSLRDFLNTKFGMELPDTISGAQIDKSFSGLGLKTFEADKAREEARKKQELDLQNKKELQDIRQEDRLEQIKAMAAMNAPMRESLLHERELSREMRERTAKTGKINTAAQKMAYGSGQLLNLAKQDKVRAEKLFTTLHVDPNITEKELKNLDPKELDENGRLMVVESAIELNKLLQGTGTPAASTLAKIVPNNFNMDSNLAKDYLTGRLNPAKQGEFLKTVLGVAQRVKQQSSKNLMEVAKQSFGPLSGFAKDKDPEVQEMYRNTLYMNGLDPDEFEEEIKTKASGLKDKAAKNKEAKSPGLDAKLKAVDTMSEEELDKELAKRGIK